MPSTGWDNQSGALLSTGRDLDVAINGDGWIAVQGPDGSEAYTRAGDLQVDANGQLTTGTGLPVLGDGGPINVPPYTSIFFARDGSISIVRAGPDARHHVDRRRASSWSIPPTKQLERGDDGLFRMKDGSDAPPDAERAARLGRARVEQRQHRRRHGQHDRTGAALRNAGQGDPHRRRERRRRARSSCVSANQGIKSYESSTVGSQDRTRCAADAPRGHVQQPRQRQHHRLQEGPRGVRRPAVPERAAGGRLDVAGHAGAHRACTSAPACAWSPPKRSTRRAVCTQTDNALDVAIEGRGFFQVQMPDGTTAYTRDGSFQLIRAGPDGDLQRLRAAAGHQHSRRRAEHHHRHATAWSACASPASRRPCRSAQLQLTDFVNPAGLQPLGENLLVGNRGQRSRADRHARPERPRHDAAGFARSVERQRGRRAGQHDRDAARLRDELEGDLDRRPDARIRQQPAVNT